MADELVKIAKMRHEEQRYAEYTFGHGRGRGAATTAEQRAKAKQVMGELRSFLGQVSSKAKAKGSLTKMPKQMHIPVGKGHTALVERMPHGLVAKTVYEAGYKTRGPTMSRQRLQGLLKESARVPVMHGTSQRFPELLAGVGRTIMKRDPNARAVYMATKRRSALRGVKGFAEDAAKARGGSPVIAHTKVDTTKGWLPHSITQWARQKGLTKDDLIDVIDELDSGAKGKERGKLWETIQRGVGAWKNVDPTTSVKPSFYKSPTPGAAKQLPGLRQVALAAE
jgi:hypothetical protein